MKWHRYAIPLVVLPCQGFYLLAGSHWRFDFPTVLGVACLATGAACWLCVPVDLARRALRRRQAG